MARPGYWDVYRSVSGHGANGASAAQLILFPLEWILCLLQLLR